MFRNGYQLFSHEVWVRCNFKYEYVTAIIHSSYPIVKVNVFIIIVFVKTSSKMSHLVSRGISFFVRNGMN